MPAPKLHDPDDFIECAMRAFWSRGFEGTSINDLVETSGINRGSIYTAFEGKRDIFLAALARYDGRYRASFLAGLTESHSPKQAILAAFRIAAGQVATPELPAGCFVVNTAIELAPHDPEIADAVNAIIGHLRQFMQDRIEAAKVAGEIKAVDTEATATILHALFLGLRVLSRSNAPAEQKDEIVRQAERLLN